MSRQPTPTMDLSGGDVLNEVLSTSRMVPVLDIRTDGGTQPRAGLDARYVDALVEDIRAGALLPPLDVMYDGEVYWLFDGFHRLAAQKRINGEMAFRVAVRIHQGTLQDAQWASFGVNKAHGLRRTNEDKQRAIAAALKHPNGANRSNREIARHLGVDDTTVGDWRKKLESGAGIPQVTERKGADGKTYSTGNIGKSNSSGRTYASTASGAAAVERSQAAIAEFKAAQQAADDAHRDTGLAQPQPVQLPPQYDGMYIGCTVNADGRYWLRTQGETPAITTARSFDDYRSVIEFLDVLLADDDDEAEAFAVAPLPKTIPVAPVRVVSERETELAALAALFGEALASMTRWGALTGHYTATGPAERGLRDLVRLTERELALLRGQAVEGEPEGWGE